MANERVVSWKAIANFAQVSREAERTERALKNLKKTQQEFNASQIGNRNNTAANKSQARDLQNLSAATKAYSSAKRSANKANSDSVKTPTENLTGRIAGYTGLAVALKEVAKQRRALNRANAAAVASPGENTAVQASSYLLLAEAQRKAATAQRALNKARGGAVAGPSASTTSSFDSASFVAGVRAAAEVKKASQEVDSTLQKTNKTIRETESVTRRASAGAGGFGRSVRSLRNDAAGAGNNIGGVRTALASLFPEWRRNELSAYRFGTVLRASFVPLIITGINLLASLLSPLAAGFIGLAGAIAPVAGLLGTLPGLLFAAAGGVGTLIAGFAGIGGALKAYSTQQKNAAKTALSGAKANKTQAKSVADHADTVASSARAIKSAEQNVADAQKNVTLARKQAREEMERMKKSIKDLALQEEGESLSLEEARKRLQQVNDDPGSTDLERRQANLAVRQAQSNLDDVKTQQDGAKKDLADAQKKGIEGSDQVVKAKRAEQDAEDALADAKRSGAKAQRGLDYSTAAGAATVDEYAEAMKKLTPEAQAVVRQLIKMKPLIDAIRATAQRGLMPGVLSFLIDSTKLFKPLNDFVATASKSFGDFFARVGKGLTTSSALESWGKILNSTNKIIDYTLDAGYNLGSTLVNIAVAARPLTEWLVRSVRDWTRSWNAMTSGEAGQKRLSNFFSKTRDVTGRLARIIRNLAKTFYNLGKGASGTGIWMLKSFEKMTKGWAKWTGANQKAIKKWADGARPALSQIAGLIGDFIQGIVDLGNQTDITSIIKQIRDQLLPAVLKVFGLFTGETAGHIISILSNIGDAIAQIAGVDGGGINTFFATLDTLSGAIENLVTNVPLAKNAIALLVGVMATKAALSFASSLLGVSSAAKSIGGIIKTAKKVRDAVSPEGKALASGAKRAKPSARKEKIDKKAADKDLKEQTKAAEKAGAKRADIAPVPGGKRSKAEQREDKKVEKYLRKRDAAEEAGKPAPKRPKGTYLDSPKRSAGPAAKGVAKAAPKRAAGAAEDAGKGLGAIAKVLPKLKGLAPLATLLPAIGDALAALGPVAAIAAVVLLGVAFVIGQVYAFSKLFPETFKKNVDALKAFGTAIGSFFAFMGRIFVFGFKLIVQIVSVAWQIIKNLFYVALDVIRVTIIRPFANLGSLIGGKLAELGRIIKQRLNEAKTVISSVWSQIKEKFIKPVVDAFKRVADLFNAAKFLLGSIIKGLVQRVIDYFNLQPTVDKVKTFLGKIHDRFVDMVDKIQTTVGKIKGVVSKAFAAIRKVVADPIGVVIGIINDGVIKPYQSLAKTFGIDTKVSTIDYKVPTFQQGGTIPGTKSNVHRDNLLGVNSKGKAIARVEAGEHIMPRKRSKWFGMLEHIRKYDSLPGHKDGGIAGLIGDAFKKKRRFDSDELVSPTAQQLKNTPRDFRDATPPKNRRGLGSASSSAVSRGEGMIGDTGWLGMCLAFVNKAWAYQVGRFRLATAKQSQNAGPRTMGGRPPGGAGVYWDTGPFGHIALAVGDGSVVSTDAVRAGRIDRVKQTKLNAWGPYKGWWSPTGDKGGKGGLGGALSDILSNLPNPKTILKSAFNKVTEKFADLGNSDFGRLIAAVPKSLFQGLLDNATKIFSDKSEPEDNTDSAHTMTSADRGKGAVNNALKLVGSYARGTNSSRRGPILVGENGPEVIYSNGGDRVVNSNLTRRLPGYNKGGVVAGMKEGASGDWVRALRSETHQGTSSKWTSALSAFLRANLTSVGTTSFGSYNKSDDFVNAVVKLLKKTKKNLSIDAIAKALKVDQTNVWQDRTAIAAALKAQKASKSDQTYFGKTASSFGSARTKWLKALEKKTGESQDGDWGEDSDEPIQHMLYHAFGLPHSDYLVHPWQKNTAIEDAIMEQIRSNKINTQFDGYLAQFNDWALSSLVRKLTELGPADGLTLAKSLSGDKNAASDYDKVLQEAYARSDAQSDSSNKDAQVNLLVSTINASDGTIGLQGVAKALSLSLDSTVGIYDLAVSRGRLVPSSKSARLDKDVIDFRKLFKFRTGGRVPGQGNGDRKLILAEPKEFILRKSASEEIERRFGAGSLDYLNNIDRFSAGGFAGGMSLPSYRGSSVNFTRSGSSDTNNIGGKQVTYQFNTNINNPTLEDGAVSVQKRITKVAQLGLLAGGN